MVNHYEIRSASEQIEIEWTEATNLVYAILVEDMFAFIQLSNFFRHLIITQAYQTALPILDLNGGSAFDGFGDQ